jgi:phage replication initiation protein
VSPADGTFSPARPVESRAPGSAIGPSSNTGQKSSGALIDFLTVVFSAQSLQAVGLTRAEFILQTIFGLRGEIVAGPIRERSWNFYRLSCVLVDRAGEVVGRMGFDGNGDTVCVSLSGAGTRWIPQSRMGGAVADHIERLGGRISRCDIAHDDHDGDALNVHALRELAQSGAFAEGGRPPKTRFISDEGHGTGCTLYVGGKGHKELCIYEKGKQQGMPESPWVRMEVRLYGKHVEGRAVPVDALRDPVAFLRGAYRAIAHLIVGACTRMRTEKAIAEAKVSAMVDWLSRQAGKSLGAIFRAFGGDALAAADALCKHVARSGSPGRFVGVMSADLLNQELQACLASS